MVLLILYTAFLPHSLYGHTLPSLPPPPKVDISNLFSSSAIHSPSFASSPENKSQPLDVPGSNLTLQNENADWSPKPTLSQPTSPGSSTISGQHWAFNATRDERAYGLSLEQCNASFPGLFADIDRAVAFRRVVGKYTADDIDISWKEYGAIRAAIVDQQVRSVSIFHRYT
jgi:hypothetical protein